MFIASEGHFAGLIAVADPIKESTLEAIQQLKQEGIKVVIVTGDSSPTAAALLRSNAAARCSACNHASVGPPLLPASRRVPSAPVP